MAKIIRLTPEITEEAKDAFLTALRSMKLFDGKISFEKTLSVVSKKATLYFSELAWIKMTSLVAEYSSEIGWHGKASRVEGSPDTYLIEDIFVYPQNVTGTTVTPDQAEYEKWLNGFDDDTFNAIRFHGHSHVNLATSPSNVDTGFWSEILEQLDGDMFYIFMIVNKKWEYTVRIYDMKANLYFDASDISVKIKNDGYGVEQLLEDAESKVKQVSYTPKTTVQSNAYGYQTVPPKPVQQTAQKKDEKKPEKKGAKPFGGVLDDYDDYPYDWYGSYQHRY